MRGARPHRTKDEVKELIDKLGLKAKKSLGQHFLINKSPVFKMTCDLSREDRVLEVGPGLGILTEELLRKAGEVVAVEIDDELAYFLKERFGGRLRLIKGDILEMKPEDIFGDKKYKVISNLPFNIASPFIRKFLSGSKRPSMMRVMVQREVAKNIKNGTYMGNFVRVFGEPRIIDYVPPYYFFPRPKVYSAILEIKVFDEPIIKDEGFFEFLRTGFSHPRKKLKNNLKGIKARGEILEKRPGELSIWDWIEIYRESRK